MYVYYTFFGPWKTRRKDKIAFALQFVFITIFLIPAIRN